MSLFVCTISIFPQEAGDNDFQSGESEEDVVDSDFSIDEDDEVRSDLDDGEDDKKRKLGGVHTKAYKVKKTITFLKLFIFVNFLLKKSSLEQ